VKKISEEELSEKIYELLMEGSASVHEMRNEMGGCYDARLLRILSEQMVAKGWLVHEPNHGLGAARYAVAYTKKVAA
jgi:hypothetical protein